MTHDEIKNELGRLILNERTNTKELLIVLKEAEDNRSYEAFHFKSLYDWLVRGFKYSSPCAMRRLDAVRLMRSVPNVKDKLEDGSLNLSVMNKAQQIMTAQEKATGAKLSPATKEEAIQKIENLSAEKATAVLFEQFPDALPDVTKPKNRPLKSGMTRVYMNLTEDDIKAYQRTKELLSHALPNATERDVFVDLCQRYIKKNDPLEQTTSAAEEKRIAAGKPSKAHIHRETMKSSGGTCVFVDETGHVCGEREFLQRDHVIPRAKGGEDTLENSRPLCQYHNFMMAEREFGKEHMAPFRKSAPEDLPSPPH